MVFGRNKFNSKILKQLPMGLPPFFYFLVWTDNTKGTTFALLPQKGFTTWTNKFIHTIIASSEHVKILKLLLKYLKLKIEKKQLTSFHSTTNTKPSTKSIDSKYLKQDARRKEILMQKIPLLGLKLSIKLCTDNYLLNYTNIYYTLEMNFSNSTWLNINSKPCTNKWKFIDKKISVGVSQECFWIDLTLVT